MICAPRNAAVTPAREPGMNLQGEETIPCLFEFPKHFRIVAGKAAPRYSCGLLRVSPTARIYSKPSSEVKHLITSS